MKKEGYMELIPSSPLFLYLRSPLLCLFQCKAKDDAAIAVFCTDLFP